MGVTMGGVWGEQLKEGGSEEGHGGCGGWGQPGGREEVRREQDAGDVEPRRHCWDFEKLKCQSLNRVQLCNPKDCSPPGPSVHGDSPGKNTGVGCHSPLQGIFPTQGWNPGLQHYRQILYHRSHQGSPGTSTVHLYQKERKKLLCKTSDQFPQSGREKNPKLCSQGWLQLDAQACFFLLFNPRQSQRHLEKKHSGRGGSQALKET